MNVLVTGNNGYIGPVLTNKLIKKKFNVVGYDSNFFYDCHLNKPDNNFTQIVKDIRNIDEKDLSGIDSIIHLAGLSNDPLGELSPKLTDEINFKATIKLAKMAKKMNIKRFVYASTQSMYGISNNSKELKESDDKNPITEYAISKWKVEKELVNLADTNFIVVFFRPSTVFGFSSRLRCDIVYNSLIGSALTNGKIEIYSDGTPWRPVVHIEDVCDAFISGLLAPEGIINGESFNVGIRNGNYTVKQLANEVINLIPNCEITYLNKHTDPRTYKVSFTKIFDKLKDYYKPKWNLYNGGEDLILKLKKCNFDRDLFTGRICNRITQLKYLIENKFINEDLLWK